MQVLTSYEARIVRALALAFFPPGGAVPWDANDTDVTTYIDGFLARLDGFDRFKMRAGFRALDLGYSLFARDARARFAEATGAEQEEYIAWVESSSFYAIDSSYKAIRTIFTFAYLSDRRVAESLEMVPPREEEVRNALDSLAPSLAALATRSARGRGAEPPGP